MNLTQQTLQTRVNPGLKKSKLSLPKVNPDPRPPNESGVNSGGGQDNQSKSSTPKSHYSPKPPKSPSSPTAPKGTLGDAPTTATATYANPIDPRDSTYWEEQVRLLSDRDTNLQNLNLQQTYSNTAFQEALGNLARQKPKDILSTQENANRGGRFYSSKTGEDIGQIEQNYFQQQSGLTRTKEQEDNLREIARKAIEQGYTKDEAAALAAAADRAAQAEKNRPAPADTSVQTLLQQLIEQSKPDKKKKKDDKPNKPNKPNKPKGWT